MPFRVANDVNNGFLKTFLTEMWKLIEVDLGEAVEIVPADVWNPNGDAFTTNTMETFNRTSDVDALYDVWMITEERMRHFQFSTLLPVGSTLFVTSDRVNATHEGT